MGLALSTVEGGNVVEMGRLVEQKLDELAPQIPVGVELGIISYQAKAVTEAIDAFIINLLQALAIVIVVLMLFMGLRSGLLMGAVLLLTVLTTFIFMGIYEINLQRISLGALVIALGMLVDNAIVITDGILVRISQGEDRIAAAKTVVSNNMWPLLGATIIAILAFAAVGLSQDSCGKAAKTDISRNRPIRTRNWFRKGSSGRVPCRGFAVRHHLSACRGPQSRHGVSWVQEHRGTPEQT